MKEFFKSISSFFEKKANVPNSKEPEIFDIELTASVLAYEIARSDGDISDDELNILMEQVIKVSEKAGKEKNEVFKLIEKYSKDSVSFHEFVSDINENYSINEKHELIKYLWKVAYADGSLDINEERLIRRLADLIKIKDLDVLKMKDFSKNE